mmetsp:Transcript_15092/g.30325  ORF Transcript_15092/g.30325 Transcript_15092/m.30325 type:complete len:329 (+) Transcript_15092:247-1233(+)
MPSVPKDGTKVRGSEAIAGSQQASTPSRIPLVADLPTICSIGFWTLMNALRTSREQRRPSPRPKLRTLAQLAQHWGFRLEALLARLQGCFPVTLGAGPHLAIGNNSPPRIPHTRPRPFHYTAPHRNRSMLNCLHCRRHKCRDLDCRRRTPHKCPQPDQNSSRCHIRCNWCHHPRKHRTRLAQAPRTKYQGRLPGCCIPYMTTHHHHISHTHLCTPHTGTLLLQSSLTRRDSRQSSRLHLAPHRSRTYQKPTRSTLPCSPAGKVTSVQRWYSYIFRLRLGCMPQRTRTLDLGTHCRHRSGMGSPVQCHRNPCKSCRPLDTPHKYPPQLP